MQETHSAAVLACVDTLAVIVKFREFAQLDLLLF